MQNRAKLFKLREEERKKWERGGEGEEKIPLSGQFLWRYLEDNTVIFRRGEYKKGEPSFIGTVEHTER